LDNKDEEMKYSDGLDEGDIDYARK